MVEHMNWVRGAATTLELRICSMLIVITSYSIHYTKLYDAHLLEEAGCFALVLEKIPASLAERVAKELTIPVIGIGAGGKVDGQVLVVQDMLGMSKGFSPRFLRRYADLHTIMTDAIQQYVTDVKDSDFPNEKEQY